MNKTFLFAIAFNLVVRSCFAVIDVEQSGVKFYIYTTRNANDPQLITADVESIIRSYFFALDPTIISLPRWQGTKNAPEHNAVILTQLEQQYNVIVIDWSDKTIEPMDAADNITNFIEVLYKQFGVDIAKIHIVGFSAGSHIAGLVGQMIQKQNGRRVGHITALDPASPNNLENGNTRAGSLEHILSPEDAEFVEVIHTNAGGFGLAKTCGHVDYYPNGGSQQPNCNSDDNCSHERAYDLLQEMWSSRNDFVSAICSSTETMSSSSCRWLGIKMGKHFEKHGVYYLETNGMYPYSKGSFYISFL